jgi:very-short-patch-repair endonuclease
MGDEAVNTEDRSSLPLGATAPGAANPSSGYRHLLPQGEKAMEPTRRTSETSPSLETPNAASSPSPLAGEGARRADEGSSQVPRHRSVPPRQRSFARRLRLNSTEEERLLWSALRNRRFSEFKFRRQVPIGRYIVDFASLEARLIVELDGSQHAESRRDAIRDTWLATQNFRILRIWNNELTQAHSSVLDAIWHALHPEGDHN